MAARNLHGKESEASKARSNKDRKVDTVGSKESVVGKLALNRDDKQSILDGIAEDINPTRQKVNPQHSPSKQ